MTLIDTTHFAEFCGDINANLRRIIMNHITRAAVLEVVGRVAYFALGVVTTLTVVFNVL